MLPAQIQLRPVRFEIVMADSLSELETKVSERLEAGCMLHGDWVIYNEINKSSKFIQAVVQMGFRQLQIPEQLASNLLVPAGGPPQPSPLLR